MIKEISHFYDNQYDGNEGLLEIDRIYLLDKEGFSQELWEELVAIYRGLPNYRESGDWFGVEGEIEYYLASSVEPVGLQIYGRLAEKDFLLWEEFFHKEILKLPFLERSYSRFH